MALHCHHRVPWSRQPLPQLNRTAASEGHQPGAQPIADQRQEEKDSRDGHPYAIAQFTGFELEFAVYRMVQGEAEQQLHSVVALVVVAQLSLDELYMRPPVGMLRWPRGINCAQTSQPALMQQSSPACTQPVDCQHTAVNKTKLMCS
jgi:hypothetical protein